MMECTECNNNAATYIAGDFKCVIRKEAIDAYGKDFKALVSTIANKIMPNLSSQEAV
jgi:hypothetical protein